MNNGAPVRMYDEAHDPQGALDAVERAAAVAICDRARDKAEAIELLDMFGLLRKDKP
jgi:hypothetical protein